MKQKDFLSQLDDEKIVAAIRGAEQATSGEIRVFVSRKRLDGDDVMDRAAVRFQKLGMTGTRERNGVLLYFVPLDCRFAVIGDRGIHEKCGEAFWQGVVAGLAEGLKKERGFTDGIVRAIAQVGDALSRYFPRRPDDRDELSNVVEGD